MRIKTEGRGGKLQLRQRGAEEVDEVRAGDGMSRSGFSCDSSGAGAYGGDCAAIHRLDSGCLTLPTCWYLSSEVELCRRTPTLSTAQTIARLPFLGNM